MTEQRHTRIGIARRPATLAAVALMVIGAATSCTEASPTPEPLEESTAAASTTTSPTPEPSGAPGLPPQARGTSKQSAIAFVEHWVSVFNYSTATLSTVQLQKASADGCIACEAMIDAIRDVARNGGHFEGSGWTVTSLEVLSNGDRAQPQLRAHIDFSPRRVVESQGAKPLKFDGGETVYTFNLALTPEEEWRVADIIGVTQ